jgi:hypothetical protein
MKRHIGAGETYGIMAEFDSPQHLMEAAEAASHAGYTVMDAYTPFPIEGLAEATGHHANWVPKIVLTGGIIGGLTGFGMQYFANVIHYPLIVGGKPLNSWPAFIPITFELTILFAALSAVLGMLALNGLPMPYHPVFNVPRFAFASRDQFFLCIESRDPKFDKASTREFLQSLSPREVNDVPW